ncbi:hypothetical protein SAMN04488120_10331 [Fontimonas thermophila]|uniref:Uncharacterized protein n=1 Tax=Fontimonas thermophila TaxID=1076937 RepID=A0A1I2I4M7_9GAMM|nr:hypothetical protein SAMN04488120_10331 [Fontimonas thermophila]
MDQTQTVLRSRPFRQGAGDGQGAEAAHDARERIGSGPGLRAVADAGQAPAIHHTEAADCAGLALDDDAFQLGCVCLIGRGHTDEARCRQSRESRSAGFHGAACAQDEQLTTMWRASAGGSSA